MPSLCTISVTHRLCVAGVQDSTRQRLSETGGKLSSVWEGLDINFLKWWLFSILNLRSDQHTTIPILFIYS